MSDQTDRVRLGRILISKVLGITEAKAEDVLRHLVASLGQAAEERGIREDEDLDAIVEEAQRRAYRESYGEGGLAGGD